jgi:pimeloyl-ACP methyl ester carboxylesterase
MADRNRHRLRIGDLELSYFEIGSGNPVLLFHGFPDVATTYVPLAESLAREGFRCIAPWLRGYWPSTTARHYDLGALVADAVGLMDALELPSVQVVGHDWGADIAYGLSAATPERVEAAVALAVPHSDALGPNRLASFQQLRRSFYMWLFQLTGLAEEVVRRNDFELLRQLWAEWSPGWGPPAVHLDEVIDTFRHDGVLSAALSYYRAVFDESLRDPMHDDLREAAARPIEVPTILLLGEHDGCIDPDMAAGAERAFRSSYETRVLAGCGHFLHLERTEAVAQLIATWFGRPSGRAG